MNDLIYLTLMYLWICWFSLGHESDLNISRWWELFSKGNWALVYWQKS